MKIYRLTAEIKVGQTYRTLTFYGHASTKEHAGRVFEECMAQAQIKPIPMTVVISEVKS